MEFWIVHIMWNWSRRVYFSTQLCFSTDNLPILTDCWLLCIVLSKKVHIFISKCPQTRFAGLQLFSCLSRTTRGASSTTLGSETYVDFESLSCDPITGPGVRQAPYWSCCSWQNFSVNQGIWWCGEQSFKVRSLSHCSRWAFIILDIWPKHLSCIQDDARHLWGQ